MEHGMNGMPGMNGIEGRAERPTAWMVLALAAAVAMGTSEAAGQQGQERLMGITELARTALDSNRDLVAAREAYTTAQEQVSEAWGQVMPSVDFDASYTRNISPTVNFLPAQIFDSNAGPDDYIGVQFGADNTYSSSIAVEQPLFRAGVFVGLGAANRFESLQQEMVRGQAQSVVTQVRMSYYQLLLAQEQVRLTAKSVDRVRHSLKETRALAAAGLSSEYDVLRLEVELANLEPNLRRAENGVAQSRRQLAVQANLGDLESLRVTGTLAEIDLSNPEANTDANREILSFAGVEPNMDAGYVVEQVGDLRSDIRQLTLTEDLRHAEMRAEQAAYLPEITLFGSYVISAQNNGSPTWFGAGSGQRAYSRFAGVRVTLPIFQGFRRDARVDQRRAALRQAQAQTEQTLDLARSEVRGIVENADEARQRAAGQRLAVTQAQRGYEIASAQYREGLGSQLELTDAEVALRQSEFNYAQAVYDYLVARAQLDEAAGQVPLVDFEPATNAGAF
jgi:outer membrane protein TolC